MLLQIASPHAGTVVVAFTVAVIAAMLLRIWDHDREPGMLWLAAAYVAIALLAAFDRFLPPGPDAPSTVFVLLIYVIRAAWFTGLLHYLGWNAAQRRPLIGALALPSVVLGTALLAGAHVSREVALLPMLWSDLGVAALCFTANRRNPGAGHAMLAFAALTGPLIVLIVFALDARPALLGEGYVWPASIVDGIVLLGASLMRNGRDSKSAQAHAQRMSNFYKALSETNQTILRTREAAALQQAICNTCVDTGHAQMACLYMTDGRMAHRVATAGPADRILAGIPNPWDTDTPQSRGSYTAQALREGVRLVCNDYQSDPRTAAWHQLAAENNVRAMVWLPLRRSGRIAGVLMLSATERHFFDASLLALLDEMTADISFALDYLDSEAQRVASLREVQAGLERFSRLFQTAPVPATIVSLVDRKVVDVNLALCQRDGIPREQFIGRATADVEYGLLPEDRELFYQQFRDDGRVRNLVVRATSRAGRLQTMLVNAEPLDYLDQACALIMILDITELRDAEEARRIAAEADAANRAKTEFLSRMSHELRTPLNAILGFSAVLRSDASARLTPIELTQLDHVQNAGWYLLRLISDVLDLSRIETGQFRIEPRDLDLAPLLDEAVQMSQPLAEQRGVRILAIYRQAPLAPAHADSMRVRQIVLNVLSNAIKYNRPGGEVRIRLQPLGADRVAIDVEDTGLGMTPQQLQQLFEPFNRLGRDREGIEGTGIGMALSRQLIELMGGSVSVSSVPEHGTTVRLLLPGALGAELAASTRPGDLDDGVELGAEPTGSVLYIEDNAVNVLLVEQMLARWKGVALHAAADARAGIERAQRLRPDLILLDMQLPDLDGVQVLRELKAAVATRDIPVVVLSAGAMADDVAQARAAGAADYWTKPIDFDRFLVNVAKLLDGGGRHD